MKPSRWMLVGVGALALGLSACSTPSPLKSLQAIPPGDAAADAPALSSYAAADGVVPTGSTQVKLEAGHAAEDAGVLRVVRSEHVAQRKAAKVVGSAALTLLLSEPYLLDDEDLAKIGMTGDPVPELAGQPWAASPALQALPQALSEVATRVYAARAWKELEKSRQQAGAAPGTVAQAAAPAPAAPTTQAAQAAQAASAAPPPERVALAQLPAEARPSVTPGSWLLFPQPMGDNQEAYRLQFSASLGLGQVAGMTLAPVRCAYRSEPVSWMGWQAEGWQRLREEREKAVAQCVRELSATRASLW